MRVAGWLLALALAMPAAAQDTGLHSLATTAEAAAWDAVGRLDIGGKGFCTGSLIAPDLVLTAAHCLYDKRTGAPVDPSAIEFRAGLVNGHSVASGMALRAVAHPAYRFDPSAGASESRNDLALVELAQPIDDGAIRPFETAPEVQAGAEVSVVSYALGRAEAPSREDSCGVLGQQRGVFVLTCDVDFGASGAPIFQMDGSIARIVSVVSAKGELGGRQVALGTSLTEPLAELEAAFEASGGDAPVRTARAEGTAALKASFVTAQGDLNAQATLPR
ncbi:trypsin-like serine peptidase [Rubellimicrobium arenae]|uniref:trypsin-like serine peptidase n=1 Tax=Rubellimicrobium arenae TaxID=2817372 RepID=UPI001B315997|nr:trypsin-like serine protease [Rubellimicrobium arenae]